MKRIITLTVFAAGILAASAQKDPGRPEPLPPGGDGGAPFPNPPRGEPGGPRRPGMPGEPPGNGIPGGPEGPGPGGRRFPGGPGMPGENRGEFRPDGRGDYRQPAPARLVPTPYIGIVTRVATPDVRAQFKLGDAFGLVVEDVLGDGPSAGKLQRNDVLVKLSDQRLFSPDHLQGLVVDAGKDKEIEISIIRLGEPQRITVKTGETQMPERRPFSATGGNTAYGAPQQPGGFAREPGNGGPGFQPQQRPDQRVQMEGGTPRIVRKDERHRYELTMGRERKFTVTDLDGKEVWSGPVSTDEQRAAIPEDFKQAFEQMERNPAARGVFEGGRGNPGGGRPAPPRDGPPPGAPNPGPRPPAPPVSEPDPK